MRKTWTHGHKLAGGGFMLAEGLTAEEATDCLARLGGWIESDRPEKVDASTVVPAHETPMVPLVDPPRFSWLAAAGLLS